MSYPVRFETEEEKSLILVKFKWDCADFSCVIPPELLFKHSTLSMRLIFIGLARQSES